MERLLKACAGDAACRHLATGWAGGVLGTTLVSIFDEVGVVVLDEVGSGIVDDFIAGVGDEFRVVVLDEVWSSVIDDFVAGVGDEIGVDGWSCQWQGRQGQKRCQTEGSLRRQ